MTFNWHALLFSCGVVLAAAPLRAADTPADADFLEYLGSIDSNEAGWHEYLADNDVGKMAKPPNSSSGGSTPATASPPQQPVRANAPTAPNTPRKVKQS